MSSVNFHSYSRPWAFSSQGKKPKKSKKSGKRFMSTEMHKILGVHKSGRAVEKAVDNVENSMPTMENPGLPQPSAGFWGERRKACINSFFCGGGWCYVALDGEKLSVKKP